MQLVHFQVGVGVFNCQQILTKISLSVILWYKTNRMWLSVVCILIDNDAGHHSGQGLLWNHWFVHACRHEQNFHGNLHGFLVTFSTIFTSFLSQGLWRVSFRTLWRVWYSLEWHFLSLNSFPLQIHWQSARRLFWKICSPTIITSAEVIIAEYDAILGQWERENFYNHLSKYTNVFYNWIFLFCTIFDCNFVVY